MWRSSSVLITQKDLSSSRSAGWSNERSHGSGDAGVSPKIGRISTERRSHFCASLQSGSCSENYVIPHDLSGQTLSLEEAGNPESAKDSVRYLDIGIDVLLELFEACE